ncbi:uncharacterized protein [Scyliorhinus torazame]|uniref:uncharacterized protein isoform X3 n=1 Tax=Scyliorhinus torazame TaxID=75743 RepID=UPI003B58E3A8
MTATGDRIHDQAGERGSYESKDANTAMVERSTSITMSHGGVPNRNSNVAKNSKRSRQQNTSPKRSEANQIVPQKGSTNRNKTMPSIKKQEDARVRRDIERDNICLLERIAKIMNPPRSGIISSTYNLKRPPKHEREEAKLRQRKLDFHRAQIENENILMLERLADIMAPHPGGPSWNDYKKEKWSGTSAVHDKLPLISQESRSVMSRKPLPKEQKPERDMAKIEAGNIAILERLASIMAPRSGGASWSNYDFKSLSAPKYTTRMPKIPPTRNVINQNSNRPKDLKLKEAPIKKDNIEAANLLMLERLAKVMAPTPGGPSWKDYESKTYGMNQRSTEFPSIPMDRGGMKQKKQKYSTSDQNDNWKDINQKLPPVSSNRKKNEN